jgi:hypothetical protein
MAMTKMTWSKGWAAGVMVVAMATAVAQTKTTVKESSSSSTLTTTASGGQGGTSSPVKDDLFNGTEIFAKGASDVTEVTMDPQSLGMVGGKESKRAHSMVLNVVRTYSYDKPGMYKIEDVETFRNKLNTGDWHCSVHQRSLKTGESTDICNKQRNDGLSEQAIITVEPKGLTFIHIIRKKNDDGSEVGEMPLVMGLHGTSSMAMMDPEGMANMAILKAQLGTMGSTFAPGTMLLDIPNDAESKSLLDSAQKLKKDKKSFLLVVPNDKDKQPEQDKPETAEPSQPQ